MTKASQWIRLQLRCERRKATKTREGLAFSFVSRLKGRRWTSALESYKTNNRVICQTPPEHAIDKTLRRLTREQAATIHPISRTLACSPMRNTTKERR
jgi:hypothetical protein